MSPAAAYAVRENALKREAIYGVENAVLVRRRPGAPDDRWPLSGLKRMTLTARSSPYGPGALYVRLDFGRRKLALSSQSWRGLGRPEDRGVPFAAFVRVLAGAAADAAPQARFETGGPSLGGALAWLAGLLGCGVLVLGALALSSQVAGLAVDLGARLLFALILIGAALPWLPGAGRRFDPRAVPGELLASQG